VVEVNTQAKKKNDRAVFNMSASTHKSTKSNKSIKNNKTSSSSPNPYREANFESNGDKDKDILRRLPKESFLDFYVDSCNELEYFTALPKFKEISLPE